VGLRIRRRFGPSDMCRLRRRSALSDVGASVVFGVRSPIRSTVALNNVLTQAAAVLECSRMAQSTPLRLLADVSPVTFHFPQAIAADIAVHFYDVSGVLIAPGAGTMDLTAAAPIASFSGAVSEAVPLPATAWEPTTATQSFAAGVAVTLSLGSGKGSIRLTPSSVVPPGGGVSYTIAVDRPQQRPPT